MTEYSFICAEDTTDLRIDRCIADEYEEISRSYIQKLIKDGLVYVNDKQCKASLKVSSGDIIRFTAPDASIPDIVPENIPLDILYEDKDVIVINKPKGMVVHPAPGHYSHTLVNALLYHCGSELSGINGVLRPGIVHQIDMDTTVARYKLMQNAKLYRGVAIVVPDEIQERIVAAQAADELLNISGVEASVVASPDGTGGIYASARSIGNMNVQILMEKLGGGGNRSAAAVKMENTTPEQAEEKIRAAIDDYLG